MKRILSLFIITLTTLTIKPMDGMTRAIQAAVAKGEAKAEAAKKLDTDSSKNPLVKRYNTWKDKSLHDQLQMYRNDPLGYYEMYNKDGVWIKVGVNDKDIEAINEVLNARKIMGIKIG